MHMSLCKPWEMVEDRGVRYAAIHGVAKNRTQLINNTNICSLQLASVVYFAQLHNYLELWFLICQ